MERRPSPERRRHVRCPLSAAVEFYHGPSRRQFPARSLDISAGGMLLYLPVAAPVATGQAVQITLGRHGRAEFASLSDRPIPATVVRVDRGRMTDIGYLPVGLQFQPPPAGGPGH